MIKVVDAKVRSLDVDFVEVSWRVEDTQEDILDYTFQILRCEAENGPYTALSGVFQDKYQFIDNTIQPFMLNRVLYYLIRVTLKATGQVVDFGPYSQEAEPDLITLELRRHLQTLYREFTGRRSWLLPARTFGQRCSCWNYVLSKRVRSNCKSCYDTGFIRGYHSPVEIWAQIQPSVKNESATNLGTMQSSDSTMRLVDFPAINPRDVIIEGENKRWRVVAVQPIEHVRAVVLQEAQIIEIQHSDIEYTVPLILEGALRDLWLSPARNYTNPQNLDNFLNEEIPNIFSLYGFPDTRL